MEAEERAGNKRGQSLSGAAAAASHISSKQQASSKGQLDRYECSQCGRVFSKPLALKNHFKSDHEEHELRGPFTCLQHRCEFSSSDRQDYQTHLVSTHGLNLVPCSYRSCKLSFLTQGDMERHRKSHTPFGCFHCQFVSKSAKEMRVHLSEHKHLPKNCQENDTESTAGKRSSASKAAPLPSKEYLAEGTENIYRTHTCPKCRRCFKMHSHLQEHLRLHFPDPNLQCPTCSRFFTSRSKLRLHRRREAGEKTHHCPLCEYSAVEKNAIRRHVASVHPSEAEGGENTQGFLCPTCGQSFLQSRALKAHMKTHNVPSDSTPLACFQKGCPFQSSERKDFLKHVAEEHGIKAAECRHHACGAVFPCEAEMEAHHRTHLAYHCSECDFSCSNKSVFLQHQRLGHPGDSQLCCDFCPFVTFNPVEFEQHVGHLHANEKIYRCSLCSYVTSHKRGLKRHTLMHTGEKPHKCSLCDFRCRDESYLSKHMLTHLDEKNFMCAECGYVTRWKHYLTVHMRKHAGDLRYSCDQCSYRCHRMDQLKSHNLRHQAKSLMCEICAYACKRKYELRNHMLSKHSGEEKRPAAFKCKYCTYTTCYRQALQNHENCKHTKLKEFRCALCDYSSFSSISLFLHKRKVHGYVPGDKAWLENYKAKEKERNSAEFVQEFYIKPSVDCVQVEQATAAPDHQSADPDSSRETAASQAVDSVFNVVSQEVVSDRSATSPEQYCTLVLTTVDDQTKPFQSEDKSSMPLNSYRSGSSTPAGSLEEDNVETQDGLCEQSDLDEPLISTSQPVEPLDDPTPAVSSAFPTLQPETRLKALKKHDKDQAEAMVLEGRVQMLVVPSEDVYRCDKCSYVTCKEMALRFHCRASCHSRAKGHTCQACSTQFKQRWGLDCHLRKKCPALPHKARTFVGVSKTLPASSETSAAGQEESQQLEGGTSSDQTEILSSDVEFQEQKVCSSHTLTFIASEHPESTVQADTLSNVDKAISKKLQSVSLQGSPLIVKTDGKFKCKRCSFSSVQLLTVKQHVSSCRGTLNKKGNRLNSDRKKRSYLKDKTDESFKQVSKKRQVISCPKCAFKCSQKRALDSHKKKGCMKAAEVQCTLCSFVAKSTLSLSRHMLQNHKKEKLAKRLRCKLCSFSCEQQRCMKQHLYLKHKGAQPHRCHYCTFSTTRRYRLEEHESLHTGIGRHSCDVCSKTFGTMTKLRQHKTRIHDKQPAHSCSLCDFKGCTPDDVRRHNRRCHTGELRHVCTHCAAQFSSELALRNHCKRVHQLQACFSCKKCDYVCSSDVTLKNHQQSKHPEVKCTTCQETFQTKQELQIHQRTHLAHRCQLCSFAAKTRQLLAQHLLGEHEDGPPEGKPLKCSTCQFVCRHQLVLEQHLRSHGTKRLYKCTDCEYATRNKQKITWHIRIHTGEKPYSCDQCSYTCSDPSRLKLHLRVHQGEKKYLCPECGYKCKWATQLKYHMTKHTGEKPYACDECEYRTNRADALRVHRDTQHCDLRPYVCEKCGKAFKTSFILKTHQQKHSDGRPYACGLCPKSFRWPAGLRHHFLSHTKQQPFRCRHCSYRAKQKFQVVKHLQRHHPEMAAEQGVLRDSDGGSLTLKEALQGTLNKTAAEDQLPLTDEEDAAGEVVVEMQNV
ncbi:zinc finger protein 142 isoform X2 [Kryptolebias marmoratus]|uniref:zinc finger protein 142 isoform X2 n=1 Tax=Kryptolebias marmoratus TaxID=37003 RepID=UPI0007F9223A|nr:zinc finger protein 142 isoform X2 [Kryptolebias marmoratus]